MLYYDFPHIHSTKMLEYKPTSHRPLRKPKKRWKEQCLVVLEQANNIPQPGIQEDIYMSCFF